MNRITLVTGGARSGKSRYALETALAFPRRLFVATAEPFDNEMRERIDKHQAERGDAFRTIEEPEDLAAVLRTVPADIDVVLIDCLTVWLGNLMHHHGAELAGYPPIDAFLEALTTRPSCSLILVTNEVGMGIVPEHPLGRRFRDHAGIVNARVAAVADRVVFMVSGIPMIIKDT